MCIYFRLFYVNTPIHFCLFFLQSPVKQWNLPTFLSGPSDCSSVYLLTEPLLGGWRIQESYPRCTFSVNTDILKHLGLFSTPEQRQSQKPCTQAWACFSSEWFSSTSQVFPVLVHRACKCANPGSLSFDLGTETSCAWERQIKSSAKRGASWSISLSPCIAWILLAALPSFC